MLLLIIMFFDFCIGSILEYYYFKQKSGLQYRTTYSMEVTNADILVFGASRANHHYHPVVFENELNLSYYNVGRDGTSFFYHAAILKSILKRHKPKIIILDFIEEEFLQDQNSYDRISCLLPYYRNHVEIKSIIELRDKYEKIKLVSKIYPYNSMLFTIVAGNMDFNKKRKLDNKGYVPLMNSWTTKIPINRSIVSYKLDNNKIKLFESFINDCMNAEIKLYIICSPYLVGSEKPDHSLVIAKKIAKDHSVDFIDFSNDSRFIGKKELFQDIGHLNDKGAILFSKIIVNYLNKK